MDKNLSQAKEAKQAMFSWDMDVPSIPAKEIDAFTLLTADIDDHEICSTCLNMGKETRAVHELNTYMYCSEHYPLKLNSQHSIIQAN